MNNEFDAFVDDINRRSMEIPFGNSRFQEKLHCDDKLTPAREYRHIILQCKREINKLKHNQFKRQRKLIEIRQAEEKLSKWYMKLPAFKYKREALLIDIAEFEFDSADLQSLVRDSIESLKNLKTDLDNCREYTREEFEAEEELHFRKKFANEIEGFKGAALLLKAMDHDSKQLEKYKENPALLLEEAKSEKQPEGSGDIIAMAKYSAMLKLPPQING